MDDPQLSGLPAFEVGESLFIFEPGRVRVLGQNGTEAVIPLRDFEAFLEHLASTCLPSGAREDDSVG